jgi:phage gp36-like protein
MEGKMKKVIFILIMTFAIGSGISSAERNYRLLSLTRNGREVDMAYCGLEDLNAAYGEDRIAGWSRLNPETVDRAVADASAEIDGYLLSGGYTVPLPGAPANIKKYCIDIASANLVLSAGVLEGDPGGKAVLEQAKIARQYLTKVAEGKFMIPGYSAGNGEVSKPPGGGVQVKTSTKLDLRGY